MQSSDDFAIYANGLLRLGHSRDWIRRNEPALRERFERDPTPFPCPPEPVSVARDRYGEL